MPTIRNTTHHPLAVPLPRGKKLHLGPGNNGEISAKAIEHPPLASLVKAGSLEIVSTNHKSTDSTSSGGRSYGPRTGFHSGAKVHRSGDR